MNTATYVSANWLISKFMHHTRARPSHLTQVSRLGPSSRWVSTAKSCLIRLPNECLNFLLSFTTSPCLPPQSAFPQSFHHRVVWHQTHQLCLCGTDLQNNFHTLLLLARVLFLVSWAGVTTGPDRETQIIKGYHAPPGGGYSLIRA